MNLLESQHERLKEEVKYDLYIYYSIAREILRKLNYKMDKQNGKQRKK